MLSAVIRHIALALTLAASLLFAAPGFASTPEWDACKGSEPQYSLDQQIAGCTKVIESDRAKNAPPHSLAVAHYNRGYAYDDKEQFERAIADYSRAIELDPSYVKPYAERCRTRALTNRDLKLALADCDKALALNHPKPHFVRISRGIIHFRLGQWRQSIAEFDNALQANPEHTTALFVRGCAKRRNGDMHGGDADIAAAEKIAPGVTQYWRKFGIAP